MVVDENGDGWCHVKRVEMFGIVGIMIVNVETTSNKSVKDWLFVLKKWRKWKRVCVRQG